MKNIPMEMKELFYFYLFDTLLKVKDYSSDTQKQQQK